MIISAMSKKDSKTFNFRLLNSEIGNDQKEVINMKFNEE